MDQIIFATSNEGKMKEIRIILEGCGLEVLSLKEARIDTDIVENGETFEENAILKVKAIRPLTDAVILADDSGLEVDALGGAPGVYSARYMGYETPYEEKNRTIIGKLAGLEGEARSARFVCVIAASLPDGEILTTKGTIEGRIAYEPAGCGGFGYDPIVYIPELGRTTAELEPDEKNRISHRGKALSAMRRLLAERGILEP